MSFASRHFATGLCAKARLRPREDWRGTMETWLQLWVLFSISLVVVALGAYKLDARAREEHKQYGIQKKTDDYV